MYELFERDVMDDLFYEVAGSPTRTRNYARTFDEFDLMGEEYFDALRELGEDESWDELNSPTNTRSIAHPSPNARSIGHPPHIKHGEISTINRAAIAYAQLVFHHFVGHYNPRGLLNSPLLPGCAGLALIHTAARPTTRGGITWNQYDVEYRVFDNTLRRVIWWGHLGNTGAPPNPQQAGAHYEDRVRTYLQTRGGPAAQTFQRKEIAQGPDLIASNYRFKPICR